ncbi:MAG: hypothetical protein A2219_08535 [Elusimicrobia bacterium RIFOXYA2_FULL_50_26]|nr:MAG: hypothetical protein A2219_08535 [Elusimicrobia bacterium RIFOXYA2_FULL_50_26]OGS25077.1 MAG: hypothetical protein A2314_03080 [Elusimicrobia bacterium RIFOXYB2_FULL_50_12]
MNKKNLINSLEKILSTKKEAGGVIELLLEEMRRALRRGDKVVLSGFGSFTPYVARAKRVRNPKSGQIVCVPPRKKVRFRPSNGLLSVISS